MTRYLLDTNVVSYFLKQHPAVTERVLAKPMHALCISSITEGELLFGLAKRPDAPNLHRVVKEFLLCVDVLPWDRAAAAAYGVLRAALMQKGTPLGGLDMLIAAHAIALKAVLVTNDQAFRHIHTLEIEDWTA